jgi:lysophospholipase L1-like esterase
MRIRRFMFQAIIVSVVLYGAAGRAEDVLVKSGEKIAFMGDSITQDGASSPGGYVHLVISGLQAAGVQAKAIPAGISGHKSNDMLGRLQRDVLAKKPDWMTLSCGVNDVWHGERGVPLPDYKTNITAIIDQCEKAGVKVVILTSTMIGEDQPNANNKKLADYNDFLRSLAAEKKCPLADLNKEMQDTIQEMAKTDPKRPNKVTRDGVHMNPAGNRMMAAGILKAFGLTAEQLAKVREAWLDVPGTNSVAGNMNLTQRQYNQLTDLAAKDKHTAEELVRAEFEKTVQALLKQAAPDATK